MAGTEDLAEQVEGMRKEDLLHIVGELKRSEMPAFWNSLSVAVFPSLYEPFGQQAELLQGNEPHSGLDLEKESQLRSRRKFFLDIPFYRTH